MVCNICMKKLYYYIFYRFCVDFEIYIASNGYFFFFNYYEKNVYVVVTKLKVLHNELNVM